MRSVFSLISINLICSQFVKKKTYSCIKSIKLKRFKRICHYRHDFNNKSSYFWNESDPHVGRRTTKVLTLYVPDYVILTGTSLSGADITVLRFFFYVHHY